MAQYNWEGTTKAGQIMKGVMEAPGEDAVKAQLRSQGVVPGKIKEAGKGLDLSLIHISEPTRQESRSRMPSSA